MVLALDCLLHVDKRRCRRRCLCPARQQISNNNKNKKKKIKKRKRRGGGGGGGGGGERETDSEKHIVSMLSLSSLATLPRTHILSFIHSSIIISNIIIVIIFFFSLSLARLFAVADKPVAKAEESFQRAAPVLEHAVGHQKELSRLCCNVHQALLRALGLSSREHEK